MKVKLKWLTTKFAQNSVLSETSRARFIHPNTEVVMHVQTKVPPAGTHFSILLYVRLCSAFISKQNS